MRVDDIDPTTGVDAGDDLVTRFNVDLVNLSVSTAFIEGDYIGDNGIGLLRLSFRVTCTENFYGSDCATFCVERDDELGHYTCDSEGNIVCREGFQNPSTNCTECILAEGCCKSIYLQQYMLDLHSSSSSVLCICNTCYSIASSFPGHSHLQSFDRLQYEYGGEVSHQRLDLHEMALK